MVYPVVYLQNIYKKIKIYTQISKTELVQRQYELTLSD